MEYQRKPSNCPNEIGCPSDLAPDWACLSNPSIGGNSACAAWLEICLQTKFSGCEHLFSLPSGTELAFYRPARDP